MASNLGFNNPSSSPALRRAKTLAEQNTQVTVLKANSPWQGYTPDLDMNTLEMNSAQSIFGLIPRADPSGRGEVLMHFPGFTHVDSTYDDSSNTGPLRLGDDNNSTEDIVGLSFIARTNTSGQVTGEFDDTTIAITAGNASDDGSCQVWRILPSSGKWQEITETSPQAGASEALNGAYPSSADGVQLFDFAIFPASGSPRTGLTGPTADGPLIVFTNNSDNVKVYAVAGASGTYEDLTEDFGTGSTNGFKARSVESWGDRLNFLNTSEGGTRHRQRLRRTAVGNADPDADNDGSGAVDFQDFQGEGLRVESLGSVLACYFEDGVAFIQRTFQSASPYTKRTITTERGLLSTHSLANLGGGIHFGIFTDGWYFLNENGQFQEVGTTETDSKWRRTFYQRLSMDKRARIDCHYDSINRWIWITLPLDGTDQNQEVWVYDILNDRIFPRSLLVTKFGESNIQISAAATIDGLDAFSATIDGLFGTLDSYGASFGVKTLIHGTHNGMVFQHDPDIHTEISLTTGNSSTPSWSYQTPITAHGISRRLKSVREVAVETIVENTNSFSGVISGPEGSQTKNFTPKSDDIGKIKTLTQNYRFTSSQLQLKLSGTAPVRHRSFEVDVSDTGSRERIL